MRGSKLSMVAPQIQQRTGTPAVGPSCRYTNCVPAAWTLLVGVSFHVTELVCDGRDMFMIVFLDVRDGRAPSVRALFPGEDDTTFTSA
jgi:hypothetical protein